MNAIDTTGCGDIFHAGVTYGIVQGWDVEKCLDLGAWAAALVSTQIGEEGDPHPHGIKREGMTKES